ncbi:MAG TPA: GGDEF and EAL domain-containing protein [Rhizomicrobium sp.]|nr:GGDEF and EAL domain-containing protein [Rhizomicrobium sp.]
MSGGTRNCRWFASVFAVLLAMFACAAGAGTSGLQGPDFASAGPVLQLGPALSPYHAANGSESDGSAWYMLTAVNESVRPVTRILLADQPYDAALRILPRRGRAAIRQVATSDADVIVENAHAYGRYAFRVTMPPATTAELALRLSDAATYPQVSAWLEPALAAHNRQVAVLFAAVAGLIACALAIMTGLAVMTGHSAPRWAALVLLGVLLVRLAAAGVFDAIGMGGVGGPYGITAMLAGLTLVAGLRLTDTIAPMERLPDWAPLRTLTIGLVAISAAALVGVPGAMLLTDMAVVIGTGLIAAHLVREGLAGAQAARVAAPSATVFALVATAAAISALGGFHSNPAAPGIVGGFAATGAVLLALAVAAGEGIAILPARRSTAAPLSNRGAAGSLRDETAEAVAASYQGVFEVDLGEQTVKLSPEAATLLGFCNGAESFSGAQWLARLHPEDREIYRDALERFRAEKGQAFRVEFRAQAENGAYCWLELRASAMGDGDAVDRYLGLIADVTTRKEADAHATRDRDALTGLRNRLGLVEELDRLGGDFGSAILALLDIDRFKSIHASLGDEGGDNVLIGVAGRLVEVGRNRAQVFRTGGDGFAVLFVHADTNAPAIGERIAVALGEPHRWNDRNAFAPASIGLALGRDAKDPFDLIRNAELGLRKAKSDGGGCARLYSPDLEKHAPADRVALDAALREALAQGEMDLAYQPIMRLADGRVAGFEALLRWNRPGRGQVAPGEFIAHAEETGFIVELGQFALSRAAIDLARWQSAFAMEPALFVGVNVSRRQLKNRELERHVSRLIDKRGLRPGTLKLELTESAAIPSAGFRDTLRRLRNCGASLAIDDFGTGTSTLSELKNVPFDTVKIDKSFLARGQTAEAESDSGVILRSIVQLAHELGRSVVLEGIENERDAAWLKEIGCDYGQGFYFAGALPRQEVPDFIAKHATDPTPRMPEAVSGVSGMEGQA